MQFTKALRAGVANGDITTSIRIWQSPRVKVGNRYALGSGWVRISAIREISLDEVSDAMARESGFANKVALLKTAQHGNGRHVYFIRFVYEA